MNKIIQLNPADNVAITLQTLYAGDLIHVNGQELVVKQDILFGHKIAIRRITNTEHVFKYGLPIGRASVDIEAGEHVHTQNLQSDYHP